MTPRSILCPLDFSDASAAALRTSVRLMRHFDAGLHVMHVKDPLFLTNPTCGPQTGHQECRRNLARFIRDAVGVETEHERGLNVDVTVGDPTEEIVRGAEHRRADLIVIGTQGVGRGRGNLLGTTTARILRRAAVPVLAVPPGTPATSTRDLAGLGAVIVLSDFGSTASAAATVGARLAQAARAPLVLLHVIRDVTVPAAWSRPDGPLDLQSAEAYYRIGREMVRLEEYGRVEPVVLRGDVVGSAIAIARARRAGLLVVGLDEGAIAHPGSVAHGLIASGTAPVLAVRVERRVTPATDGIAAEPHSAQRSAWRSARIETHVH